MTTVEFHPLRVAVEPLTDDAVAVTFDVPDDLARFRYLPGQHVTPGAETTDACPPQLPVCANANSGTSAG